MPTTNDGDFEKVLAVASEQLKSNKIQVRFGPTGRTKFTIDEASLKDSLVAHSVAEEVFRGIFNTEISFIVDAVLQGKLEDFMGSPYSGVPSLEPAQQAGRRAEIKRHAERIERELVPQLRGRYLIKASSKHPRLRELRWEIARKLSDSSNKGPVPPFATLDFEAIWPERELGIFSWLSPLFPADSMGRREGLAFDCDEGDIEDLIQVFQAIKASLVASKRDQR